MSLFSKGCSAIAEPESVAWSTDSSPGSVSIHLDTNDLKNIFQSHKKYPPKKKARPRNINLRPGLDSRGNVAISALQKSYIFALHAVRNKPGIFT
jgi:hypothetical protein